MSNTALDILARNVGKTARIAAMAKPGALNMAKMLDARAMLDRTKSTPTRVYDEIFIDEASHMSDAWTLTALSKSLSERPSVWSSLSAPPIKALSDYSDAELVMHMLGRGYACMKVPVDGRAPEVLR